jgi:hypothetical protein
MASAVAGAIAAIVRSTAADAAADWHGKYRRDLRLRMATASSMAMTVRGVPRRVDSPIGINTLRL